MARLAVAGIGYSAPAAGTNELGFLAAPDEWRPWEPPSSPTHVLHFLRTALRLASPSGAIWLFRRHGRQWREPDDPIPSPLINRAIRAVGIPAEFEGAIEFSRTELADLLLVLMSFYLEAGHVGQDLSHIPEERSCVLMTSHHGEVYGHFPDTASRRRFEAGMREAGYGEDETESDGWRKTDVG